MSTPLSLLINALAIVTQRVEFNQRVSHGSGWSWLSAQWIEMLEHDLGFEEKPYMGMMIRCPQMVVHLVCVIRRLVSSIFIIHTEIVAS